MSCQRIILMYISEVSGHHSATLAIEEAIKTLSPGTETLNINAFNYTNPISEKIVNRFYIGVIKRTPQIWEYLYDNPKVLRNLGRTKLTIPDISDLLQVHSQSQPWHPEMEEGIKPTIERIEQYMEVKQR